MSVQYSVKYPSSDISGVLRELILERRYQNGKGPIEERYRLQRTQDGVEVEKLTPRENGWDFGSKEMRTKAQGIHNGPLESLFNIKDVRPEMMIEKKWAKRIEEKIRRLSF